MLRLGVDAELAEWLISTLKWLSKGSCLSSVVTVVVRIWLIIKLWPLHARQGISRGMPKGTRFIKGVSAFFLPMSN